MGSQESVVPATPAQLKLYTHARVFPGDASFNLGGTFHIQGEVDVPRLRRVIGRLGMGIKALNTSFERRAGTVYAVHRPPNVTDPADLVRVTTVEGEARGVATRSLAARADRPIPPEAPRQYEFEIFCGDDGLFVVLSYSHLVCDAYSFYMFVAELERLYVDPDAELNPAALDDPGALVQGPPPASAAALEFFRGQLGHLTTFTDDRMLGRRTPTGAMPGHQLHIVLTDEQGARVTDRIDALDCGAFAFFLSAYLVTLARITGRRQVITGLPLANRRGIRQRQASGYFVNTLPLAVDLTAYETFGDLCRAMQETTHSMLRHQSFDLTAHLAEVCPGAVGSSLNFSSAFTYYKMPLEIRIPGCHVESKELPRKLAKYPLMMSVEHFGNRFNVNVECSEEQWQTDPRAVMEHVLETVSRRNEDVALRDIPGLSPEREKALSQLVNGSPESVDHPAHPSLTSWFDEVARTHPDRVAVQDTAEEVTYAELADRSDRVALELLHSVQGERVGVAMRRGADLIAVILGVLKAGKSYVPLDPGSPSARIGLILDSFPDGLPLVCDEDRWPELEAPRLHADRLLAARPPGPAPEPVKDPETSAYTIFTSGSTGRPKGVTVTHHNVIRLLRSTEEHFDFGPDDVWSLFHSYAFDFAVWEMFGALLYGGRLAVVPTDVARSPEQFRDFLTDHAVTVLNQTPSAFGQLLKVLRPADAVSLNVRYVVLGGEAVRYAALRPWYETMGEQARLVNMYGITETTVHVTHHAITPADVLMERASVIGRPLADLSVAVVDEDGHHCPPGVPGELVVSGPGVSRGYLGLPGPTAERFVRRDGRPAYRTGDLGSVRPDGTLVHLGRIDRQVQLRGFRIELGEIDSALLSLAGVRECTVLADQRDPARPALTAFVTGTGIHEAELKRSLHGRLPAYMVPGRIVVLEQLPLTVNGKVDEQALPWPPTLAEAAEAAEAAVPPGGQDAPPGDEGAAPTALERVRAVWRTVLPGVEFGSDDNFFDIGGSSMHVADVHSRLSAQLPGAELEMIDLFTYTTVRRLAAHLDGLLAAGQDAEKGSSS
ncbi:amino acid adenylation domain-containing protein [Streptomyces sp. NPDC007346]|uniref:non-ribosomal peptide synthetase n=1 Tax=Streptomyces sp. NPDC007346 TaxID=3154682 RepID=UPI0034549AEF